MLSMRRVGGRLVTLVVAGALLGCADGARGPTGPDVRPGSPLFQHQGADTFIANQRIPVDFVAPTCAGPEVRMTGTFHSLFHVTLTPTSNLHVNFNINMADMSGELDGVTYRAAVVTQDRNNFNGTAPLIFTVVNSFRIIAEGQPDNLLVHHDLHITINANGEVTASADNFKVDCQG